MIKEKYQRRMVTPKDLELFKVLKEAKLSLGQRAKVMKFSYATMMAMEKCETWEDYLAHREFERVRMSKKKTPRKR